MAAGVRFRGFGWRPLGRRDAVIAGPSGSGKSTLLHAIAGALGTTIAGEMSGEIVVDGRIGLLLQNPHDAIVAERMGRDVAFGPENFGLPRGEIWSRVDAALEAVRLTYGREHFTAALSGGETQRLALAGVLALRPDLVLLDEPTAMLDDANAQAVREAIVEASAGATLIVVEHRIGPWLDHVDRVVVLSDAGEIVADGSVAQFLAGPAPRGVWVPGLPDPAPLDIPIAIVDPASAPLVLEAHDVSIDLVTRTLRGTQRTRALHSLTTSLEPGTSTAFTGPSGAGKSTALAAFAGLLDPVAGELRPDVRRWASRKLAAHVGWVPQNPEHGFLTSTVREEVFATAQRLDRPVDVDHVLDALRLSHRAETSPYRLSGGEQRRLALAAALAHRPGVVLLDEPTVGQDRDGWAAVVGWLASAVGAGAAVAVSTHDAELAARCHANIRLNAGMAV
ncbi:ATP-binding cassette domain-containing protein [soil metagenome]